MCVLHVHSRSNSFAEFLKTSSLPFYRVVEKGEGRFDGKGEPSEVFVFSCDVSKKEWTDLDGQLEDAFLFLQKYEDQLKNLRRTHEVDDIRLDFPYHCRLGNGIMVQCDYLSPQFLKLAGELGIGIELSQYPACQEE